jgi:hypothetical protein
MNISNFDDLLSAARAQPEPQRLLFVFANIVLPDDASPAQRAAFERGEGGALVPQMCVDKSPDELVSFDALKQEAERMGSPWGMVFAAALAGKTGLAPTSKDAEKPLQDMVEAIRLGRLQALVPFNPAGDAVQLE